MKNNALEALVYESSKAVELPEDGMSWDERVFPARESDIPEQIIRILVPIWQFWDSDEQMSKSYGKEFKIQGMVNEIPRFSPNARPTYELLTQDLDDAPSFEEWSKPVPVAFPDEVRGFEDGSFVFDNERERLPSYQERYVEPVDGLEKFISEILQVDLSWIQREAIRTIQENPRTGWCSVNSMGKSYLIACLLLGWTFTGVDRQVLLMTSRAARLSRSGWSDFQKLHALLENEYDWLDWGRRPTDGNSPKYQPSSKNHPDHRVDGISPKRPDDSSGSHEGDLMVIIDEFDKPDTTRAHLEEAKSSLANKLVGFGNPPLQKSNVFYDEVIDDSTWQMIEHRGGFDSPNVRRAMDEDDVNIPALVSPEDIEMYWNDYHDEPYPGLEEAYARTAANGHVNLHQEWYKRVTGEMPPSESQERAVWDEDTVSTAQEKYDPVNPPSESEFTVIGIDLANQGDDKTVAIGLNENEARVWREADLTSSQNVELIARAMEIADVVVVDDNSTEILQSHSPRFDDVIAYKSQYTTRSKRPRSGTNHPRAKIGGVYKNWRAFSHQRASEWLDSGSIESNDDLIEQLRAAAQSLRWEGEPDDDASVDVTSKDALRPRIRADSPDHLDGFIMACFGLWWNDNQSSGSVTMVGYDDDHPIANALRGGRPKNDRRLPRNHPDRGTF